MTVTPARAIPTPGGGWVDHVVWGTADTASEAEHLAGVLGVEAQAASTARPSSYPTTSRSISLGGERFFEIYGPNPGYDGPSHPMHDLLRSLDRPRLLVWFARVASLPSTRHALEAEGYPTRVMIDEWERRDAASFRNAHLIDHVLDPSVPYLIEWRDRLDMDQRMAAGLDLLGLEVVAQDPERTEAAHRALGLDVPIRTGQEDGFSITVGTPNGEVVL